MQDPSDEGGRPLFRIALVSDFFYPGMGGVENHMYMLAQCLILRGHKVIVITRSYDNRSGIRYVTNGLKVFYMPVGELVAPSGKASLPTFYGSFPVFRQIVLRERIQIVHSHQASSVIGHESLLHAKTMGLSTCFTDHSLLGFADASSIHLNKFLKFTMADIDHSICVSYTSKENTVLRGGMRPNKVSVIPNAIDATFFTPDPSQRNPERVTIVIMSRLVYRKGVDLLVELLPKVLESFPHVDVIIGGDGPMRVNLEEMRERHQLVDRIQMLGMVPHSQVRDVLTKGHIFLNCSLTEAFCIAIVEAASCGLLVVSTRVGGVPEVLPHDMLLLAEPIAEDLVKVVGRAIAEVERVKPHEMHERVCKMYSWHDVAQRTDVGVYQRICPKEPATLLERLHKYQLTCGTFAGMAFSIIAVLDVLLLHLLMWIWPESEMDIAIDFDLKTYQTQSTDRQVAVPVPKAN